MKTFTLILMLAAACGGKQSADPGGGSPPPPTKDTRTPLEVRRDAACDKLGPKITQCAVDDAKADLASGKTSQKDFDADTSPDLVRKHTAEFMKTCKVQMSSRQVRVLEVCFQQETECDPLGACLEHLSEKSPAPAAK